MELVNVAQVAYAKLEGLFSASGQFYAKKCIPTNDTLSGPLSGPLNTVEGAIGGLMFKLVIAVIVVLTAAAVALILSKKAPALLRAIALVAVLPLGVITVIIMADALYTKLNGSC